MLKCNCYEEFSYCLTSNPPIYKTESRCLGTKERDLCSCGGDKTKCNFYSHVREEGYKDINENLDKIELEFYRQYVIENDLLYDVLDKYNQYIKNKK